MRHSDHPDHTGRTDPSDHAAWTVGPHAVPGHPAADARADGLRRLSTLTVTAAVAAAAATAAVAMAAHRASSPPADPAASVSTGSDDLDGDRLQAPAEAPQRSDRAPVGVSSGS